VTFPSHALTASRSVGQVSSAPPRRARLHSLTSLRFFAAFFVVLHHSIGPSRPPIIDLGYLGVTFFFILSGFVLTWSDASGGGAKSFYRNRIARILPMHYLTLLAAVVIPLSLAASPWLFAQNVTMLQAWSPTGAQSYNWVSWSISDEAFFYLLFPLAILVIRRLGNRALIAVAIGAWAAMAMVSALVHTMGTSAQFYVYDFPPYRFGEFLIGVVLALLMTREFTIPRALVRVLSVAAVAVLAAVFAIDFSHPLGRSEAALIIDPIVVVLLYVVVTEEGKRGDWWLTSRWLRRLGEWSFCLYLVHALVTRVVSDLIGRHAAGYLPAGWVVVTCAASIAVAGLCCEYFEKPIERRLRSRSRSERSAVRADPM
jgi:peptidoglycan/LPS O-acetylase OafA/YrhL